MWQSNQAKGVLRARDRERQKRQAFGARSIKRVDVDLAILRRNTAVETGRMPAKLVLNEVSPGGTELLTPMKIPVDTDLELRLEQPIPFAVRGRVVRVQDIPFSSARVLSDRRMTNRTTVVFLVADDAEKAKLEKWISDVRANYLGGLAIAVLPGEPRLSPLVAPVAEAAPPAAEAPAAAAVEAAVEAAAEAPAAPAAEEEKKAA